MLLYVWISSFLNLRTKITQLHNYPQCTIAEKVKTSFLLVISQVIFQLRYAFNPLFLCSRFLSFISVSGLDPASPYYTDRDPEVRLDPTDANYVDVIHTNLPIIGTEQRVGHIDFFPNGGSVQPGCFTNKPLGQ